MGWLDGSDYDVDYGEDYWSSSGDSGDMWDASDVDANSDWTDYGDSSGSGDGGGTDYSSLINAGLGAAEGYASQMAASKLSKEQLELISKLKREEFAAQKAEEEKYYQLRQKEMSDAFGKYSGNYYDPADPANAGKNPTNIFGLLTPKPTTGPLANGW